MQSDTVPPAAARITGPAYHLKHLTIRRVLIGANDGMTAVALVWRPAKRDGTPAGYSPRASRLAVRDVFVTLEEATAERHRRLTAATPKLRGLAAAARLARQRRQALALVARTA